ncbi:MAG: DUF885 domain-containing protein [Candidatus Limnocylindrales bacterium]
MSVRPGPAPSLALPPFRDQAGDGRAAPRTAYELVLRQVLDGLFAAHPVRAGDIGYHADDDRWPDVSEAARLSNLALLERLQALVDGLPEAELTPDERIDRGILAEALEGLVFEEATLREQNWDPLSYVYLVGSGLFGLLSRDYAPWAHRGSAFAWRVARLPELLAAAAANLVGTPQQPVSLLHLETALGQLGGIMELVDEGLAQAAASDDGGLGLATHLAGLRPLAQAAVEDFRRQLEGEIRARAEGEGRLGRELFRGKLRHTLASDLGPDEVLARARRDVEVVRAEIVRLAREAWPEWLPGEAMPADDETLVRRVLDAIAVQHRQPEELLGYCQAEVARIEAFVRERDLLSLPEEPLRITWTPTFMRAYGGAFLYAPGPLETEQPSYLWITPPGEDWPTTRTESYLREDNDRMLRLLCLHEAIPGHYLQLARARRTPDLTRAVFGSGMFAEGWAVYVTQVMMDVGYGEGEAALLLNHWTYYLRAVINAVLDVAVHCDAMTEREALELMIHGGFQEEQEARAKWLRARITATQLSTYYLGSLEMWDLELEARRRAATATGADPARAVPAPRIAGQLGETPGFAYRTHLASVIAHGAPPIKWVRRILSES